MNRSLNLQLKLLPFLKSASLKRGAIFGSILISALLAFELFNFGTTSFALQDVLGNLKFAGIQWSAILAFAFCGIDFAGIARLFTPEQGADEPLRGVDRRGAVRPHPVRPCRATQFPCDRLLRRATHPAAGGEVRLGARCG